MKRKSVLIVLLSLLTFSSANANWMTSYEDAQKLAIATNKLIVIDFWATWCRPCLKMDTDTWNKPEVQKMLNNFVPLKIDIDSNRSLAQKYSANRIPYVVIIDPNGEIVYEESGYKDQIQMLKVLKKYAINTSALQEDFLSYRKAKSGEIAMTIAEKYIDYSIYVDKTVRRNFLALANKYLKDAKKIVGKKKFKENFLQRADLLKYGYENLVRGKYEKVIQVLNKDFKEENITEKNRGLYNFLHFASYNKLQNKEEAKKWYEKLKTDKNAKLFLLKSRKI